jgi:hypothetical protein
MQRRCMEVSLEWPTKLSICKWYKLFSEAGCVCVRKSSGKQVTDTEVNEGWTVVYFAVQESWQVAQQLSVAQLTVHKILLINVGFHSYRYQLLQHVTAQYKGVCYTYFTWKTMNELIQQNLCLMMKPLSRCLGILGYVGEEQSALMIWRCTGQSEVQWIWCCIQTKRIGPFSFFFFLRICWMV